jgi:crotonobetainyl-CoA:carnitine CoA-transferase CaiB-like acyl-CoA transferase
MVLVDDRGERHLGAPIKFRNEPARPNLALPALGEHTDEMTRSR